MGPEAVPSLQQWNAVKDGVVDMHLGPANYFRGSGTRWRCHQPGA
ncbi:MAG: hypothetical protein R3E68_21150 [Burkholderiaceae bacterium]